MGGPTHPHDDRQSEPRACGGSLPCADPGPPPVAPPTETLAPVEAPHDPRDAWLRPALVLALLVAIGMLAYMRWQEAIRARDPGPGPEAARWLRGSGPTDVPSIPAPSVTPLGPPGGSPEASAPRLPTRMGSFDGVRAVRDRATGTVELIVDPFPEEDAHRRFPPARPPPGN